MLNYTFTQGLNDFRKRSNCDFSGRYCTFFVKTGGGKPKGGGGELTRQGYRVKTHVNALTLKCDMPAGQLLYINWGHYIITGSAVGIVDGGRLFRHALVVQMLVVISQVPV